MFKDVVIWLSLLSLMQLCEANLEVTAQQFTYNDVIMSDTNIFEVATFIVDFSEDIFIKSQSSTKKFTSVRGNDVRASGEGLASLSCSGSKWWNGTGPTTTPSDGKSGTPTNLIVAPGVEEPFSAMLSGFGAYSFNETRSATRWSAVILLQGGDIESDDYTTIVSKADFEACKPVLTFSDGGANSLSDATGNVFTGDVSFDGKYKELECNQAGVMKVIKRFDTFLSLPLDNQQQLNQLELSIGSILGLSGYSKCLKMATDLVSTTQRTATVTSNGCNAEHGTDDWTADPCCNPNLRQSQCCSDREFTYNINALDSIKESVIDQNCGHPAIIKEMLTDFILVERKSEEAKKGKDRRNKDEVWDELTSFVSTCRQKLDYQDCQSDNDCYSKECKDNRCAIHYDKQEEAWANCVWDLASEDILEQGTLDLGLNASVTSKSAWTEQAAPKIKQAYRSDTCVGPRSWEFKEQFRGVRDEDGNWDQVVVPGNETGCLEMKNCNFNEHTNFNEVSCTGESKYFRLCVFGNSTQKSQIDAIRLFTDAGLVNLQSTKDATGSSVSFPWTTNLVDTNAKECLRLYIASEAQVVKMELQVTERVGAYTLQASDSDTFSDSIDPTYRMSDYNNPWVEYDQRPPDTTWISGLSKQVTGIVTTYHAGEGSFCGDCEAGGQHCQDLTTQPGCYGSSTVPCSEHGDEWAEARKTYSNTVWFCKHLTMTKSACDSISSHTETMPYIRWEEGENEDEDSCTGGDSCSRHWLSQEECTEANGHCLAPCFDAQGGYKQCSKNECAAGRCDFDHYFEGTDSDPYNTHVCVAPYEFHPTEGYNLWCNVNEHFRFNAGIGCITNHTDESQCKAFSAQAMWLARAMTKEACEALPTGCREGREGKDDVRTLKTAIDCASCGGVPSHQHRWVTGEWDSPTWGPNPRHFWMDRKWTPANQWKTDVFSESQFEQGIEKLAASIVGRNEFNDIRKVYGQRLSILKDLSCDCTGTPDPKNDCFDTTFEPIKVETCLGEGQLNCNGITFTCSTTACVIENFILETYKIVLNSNLVSGSQRRRLASSSGGNNYDVVANSKGHIVGQLIGPAKQVTASGEGVESTITLCMDINPEITMKSKFTVYDFATGTGNTGTPTNGGILNITVTNNGKALCGVVTDFTSSGIYFPIKRIQDYVDYVCVSDCDGGGGIGSWSNSANAHVPSVFASLLVLAFLQH